MVTPVDRPVNPVLWMVIPCYNEEETLPLTAPLFLEELKSMVNKGLISDESRICFIDDGSQDRTWPIILKLSGSDPHFEGLALSRNQGHQNALLAGLMEARAKSDICISMDCDGQDDVHAAEAMVLKYLEGYEVVYGVRKDRSTDSFFKRKSAEGFYKVMRGMGADVVYNSADYRLLSRTVLDHLADYHEVNLFLRGIIPLIGFPSTVVYYERHERVAGHTHYPLAKMASLAMDGITSFSTKPIRIISALGVIFACLGFIGIIWALVTLAFGETVPGWTSVMSAVLIIGGITVLGVGIIGEYVGKIYLEVKARPRYIVSTTTWSDGEKE